MAGSAALIGVTPATLFHGYGGTLLVILFLFAFRLIVQRWILAPPASTELKARA